MSLPMVKQNECCRSCPCDRHDLYLPSIPPSPHPPSPSENPHLRESLRLTKRITVSSAPPSTRGRTKNYRLNAKATIYNPLGLKGPIHNMPIHNMHARGLVAALALVALAVAPGVRGAEHRSARTVRPSRIQSWVRRARAGSCCLGAVLLRLPAAAL